MPDISKRGQLMPNSPIRKLVPLAEEAIQRSEEKYRLLVETPNSIVMTADKNLNVTYMNKFGLDFFGPML